MTKFFTAAAAILCALLLGACSSQQPPSTEFITADTILLDVRSQKEFEEKHIPGSLLIPHDQLKTQAPALLKKPTAPIVLFCRSGRRSAIARKTLESLGYTAVTDLGSIENAAKILKKELKYGK